MGDVSARCRLLARYRGNPRASLKLRNLETLEPVASAFTLVVNRPIHLPGFAAIGGGFPTPVEFGWRDVLKYHALHRARAVFADHLALQNHLAVFEVADKIQIAA